MVTYIIESLYESLRERLWELMKVVILAGGQQSTISNSREGIPKPMVEVGEKPLLWHIMKQYSHYGIHDFIICGGYKVNMIKDYFTDYYIYQSDITVDLEKNIITIHKKITENWNVTVVDTGLYSSTGQRVNRIRKYIEDEDFIVTYGDCLSNINITKLYDAYCSEQKLAMVALARPAGRNRILPLDEVGNIIIDNRNPHMGADAWTNANTFVLNRRVFDFLQGNYSLEDELIPKLSERGEITTYKHEGFWRAVETNRDKSDMEGLWNAGMAPWKVWEDK